MDFFTSRLGIAPKDTAARLSRRRSGEHLGNDTQMVDRVRMRTAVRDNVDPRLHRILTAGAWKTDFLR